MYSWSEEKSINRVSGGRINKYSSRHRAAFAGKDDVELKAIYQE